MKTPATQACPVPAWAFVLTLRVFELAIWIALICYGVGRGWWTVSIGVLLAILLPLALGMLMVFGSYRLSVEKGMALTPSQRMRGKVWLHFFLLEYAHFCKQAWLQLPFPAFFRTKGDRGRHAARGRVIVLQHGYSHTGGVWSSTAKALEAKGFRVYTIDQPQFASIDTMADRLAERIQDVLSKTGAEKVTLIAHSMGGLIARAYLRAHGDVRVEQLITLGSPHHGTFHAYLARGINGKQMRPGNAWLMALNQYRVNIPFTSIYSVHDTVISPQDSSRLPEAEHIILERVGHVAMPSGQVVREVILNVLR